MKMDYLGEDQLKAIADLKSELIADGSDDQEAQEAVDLALTGVDDDFDLDDLRGSLEQLYDCGKLIDQKKKLQ